MTSIRMVVNDKVYFVKIESNRIIKGKLERIYTVTNICNKIVRIYETCMPIYEMLPLIKKDLLF